MMKNIYLTGLNKFFVFEKLTGRSYGALMVFITVYFFYKRVVSTRLPVENKDSSKKRTVCRFEIDVENKKGCLISDIPAEETV